MAFSVGVDLRFNMEKQPTFKAYVVAVIGYIILSDPCFVWRCNSQLLCTGCVERHWSPWLHVLHGARYRKSCHNRFCCERKVGWPMHRPSYSGCFRRKVGKLSLLSLSSEQAKMAFVFTWQILFFFRATDGQFLGTATALGRAMGITFIAVGVKDYRLRELQVMIFIELRWLHRDIDADNWLFFHDISTKANHYRCF